MATLNISLPGSMREFVDQQVAAGGYSTASEYIRDLIRQAQKQAAEARLEEMLLKGLDSGFVDADEALLEQMKSRLLHRDTEQRRAG